MADTETPVDLAQKVVVGPANTSVFLTLTIREGAEDVALDLLADLGDLMKTVNFRVPTAEMHCVAGIGARFWERAFNTKPPEQLHPFIALQGDRHTAPSTPGDLLFHMRSLQIDICIELLRLIYNRLGDAIASSDEVHGFRYYDNRDLLGFVDGTANPVDAAANKAVYIQDGEWMGGSYVIVQKYTHDMPKWDAQTVEKQQDVIGRSKLDDIEMADDVKPSNSHVALNTIEDENGVEHDIFRGNMPFGNITGGVQGTYFIGYAADVSITEQMLENMFIGKPRGNTDQILEFSTAETGCLFFIPPVDFLENIADHAKDGEEAVDDAPDADALSLSPAPEDEEEAPSTSDGSLSIGSLKGRS